MQSHKFLDVLQLASSFMQKKISYWFLVVGTLLAFAGSPQSAMGKPFVDKIPPDVQIKPDLEYVPGGGASQSLDLYLPKSDAPLIPLVVYIHGGGWVSGTDKDWHPSFCDLLEHGFAVATINYRLTKEALHPAQIYDCKAAIRWLRAHAADYHLNPDRIGVWGHSAGGHLAALLGVTNDLPAMEGDEGTKGVSSSVQAACDWSGPTDLVKTFQDGPAAAQSLYPLVVGLVGGPDKANKENLAQASPVTYVSAKSVPFLIMQGDKDNVVPLDQSSILDAALKKAGVESTLIFIPGGGHGIGKPDDLKPVTAFFEKQIKKT
jgi:acetyl esterase/lipase